MPAARLPLATILLVLSAPASAAGSRAEAAPLKAARRTSVSAAPELRPPPAPPPLAATLTPPRAVEDGTFSLEYDPEDARRPETPGPPDAVPEWPGRTGDTVRLAGRTYVLAERLGRVVLADGRVGFDGRSPVYRVKDEPLVVKLIYPPFKNVGDFGTERESLEEMSRTPIAHSRLKASSVDGLVLVKEFVDGTPLREVVAYGPLGPEQRAALLNLAAQLVSLGRTADLNVGNLVWQAEEKRLVLVDSGGFSFAQPWTFLDQIINLSKLYGIDGAVFLAALRERLGSRSPAWRAVEDNALFSRHRHLLEVPHRRDQR